jgi:DNA polymerase-1
LKTIICDLEADGLSPTQIWIIVTKDVDDGSIRTFKELGTESGRTAFLDFAKTVDVWVGHNFLGYDRLAILAVLGYDIPWDRVIDTLVVSRLLDACLVGKKPHSLEAWGERLGKKKLHAGIEDWSKFTPEMEERCLSDAEVNFLLFKKFRDYIYSPVWSDALRTEHFIHHQSQIIRRNGFAFDLVEAEKLKAEIDREVDGLTEALQTLFPPRSKCLGVVTPKVTKHGTLNRTDFRWLGPNPDLSDYSVAAPFSRISFEPFNPGSAPQRIDRLWEAGWKPTDKTDGHKDAAKRLRDISRTKRKSAALLEERRALEERLERYAVYGWKTSEENLNTLPDTAPDGVKSLVRWLILSNRSSTLQTWFDAYDHGTGRIHGSFNHIGAWTHRMSHDRPNMGNIPKYDAKQPHKTPYSDRMRALWTSAAGRYLVGVDADSIQLRILAHYINDLEFTTALIAGKKEDGTDPHSVNQRALGRSCRSRDDAKTFIYAWLLGAGIGKVAEILGCSREEAEEAVENFINRFPGLKYIREEVIPNDAARGYFRGFDGRFVRIWGDDISSRSHFALAGYLQNGEVTIMKRASQLWVPRLDREKVPYWWVNFVHDEYQIETIRDLEVAKYVATTVADAIRQVGVDLGLHCPMAGSVLSGHVSPVEHTRTWNETKQKFDVSYWAIGDNWMDTH